MLYLTLVKLVIFYGIYAKCAYGYFKSFWYIIRIYKGLLVTTPYT
jgi:hypothetical protein